MHIFTKSGPLVPSFLFPHRPGAAKQWMCACLPFVYVDLFVCHCPITSELKCPWQFIFYFKVLSLWLCFSQFFERAHSFTHTASDCNCSLCLYYSYGESKETGHMRLFALDPHNSTTVIFPVFQECWSHDPSF